MPSSLKDTAMTVMKPLHLSLLTLGPSQSDSLNSQVGTGEVPWGCKLLLHYCQGTDSGRKEDVSTVVPTRI